MAKYDIAISFAGEQRALAERFAKRLDASGYAVFYDRYEQAELWGRDLTSYLGAVYDGDARFCLVILSNDYVKKAWTNLERQHALSRFMENREDYLLCLKTDCTSLPGLPSTVAHVSLESTPEERVFELLIKKLGKPNHDGMISQLDPADVVIANEIIRACYRRAVFTRMDSEIDISAMRSSLAGCLSVIQPLAAKIADFSLQYATLGIIMAFDAIDRITVSEEGKNSCELSPKLAGDVDRHKMDVVGHLLEIRRAAQVSILLPYNLQADHFFKEDDANLPPSRFPIFPLTQVTKSVGSPKPPKSSQVNPPAIPIAREFAVLQDIAHQLRAPIMLSIARIDSIVARNPPFTPELRAVRALCHKAGNVARMASLYGSLASNSEIRLDSKRIDFNWLTRSLVELAADTKALMDPNRKITIQINHDTIPSGEDSFLLADHALLEQAMASILDNASKYSYGDSVIRVFGLAQSSGHFKLTFSNRGIPIRQEDSHKCMQRGWRGPEAILSTGEGTGIGLWIADRIMRAHGGSLDVSPTTQEGITEISLMLRTEKGASIV